MSLNITEADQALRDLVQVEQLSMAGALIALIMVN